MAYVLAAVAFLAILVAGWLFRQFSEGTRDSDLQKMARHLAMDFRRGLVEDLRLALPRFRVISNAMGKGADFRAGINTITGSRRGVRLAFFDCDYARVLDDDTIHNGGCVEALFDLTFLDPVRGERTVMRRFSAVAVELSFGAQPLVIRPERVVDKIAGLIGYEDIDFDSMPEFSRKFYVNGPDRRFAGRIITSAVARFFMDRVDCTVDLIGPWMLLYTGRRLSARQAERYLELASELAGLLSREYDAV